MSGAEKITVKKGNSNKARRRPRVSPDKKGTRIPPLPRGFKESQCDFDRSIGRWVVKAYGRSTPQRTVEEKVESFAARAYENPAA